MSTAVGLAVGVAAGLAVEAQLGWCADVVGVGHSGETVPVVELYVIIVSAGKEGQVTKVVVARGGGGTG